MLINYPRVFWKTVVIIFLSFNTLFWLFFIFRLVMLHQQSFRMFSNLKYVQSFTFQTLIDFLHFLQVMTFTSQLEHWIMIIMYHMVIPKITKPIVSRSDYCRKFVIFLVQLLFFRNDNNLINATAKIMTK